MKKGLLSLIVLLSVTLLLIGCGTSAATPATSSSPATSTTVKTTAATSTATVLTPKKGGTAKIITSSPNAYGWPADIVAYSQSQIFYDSFLHSDSKGGIVPGLAESYKIADDLKSITFTLRKGVIFHDGSVLNSQVAKWNLDNIITAKLSNFWASVDVVDDYTVKVNLTRWSNLCLNEFVDGPRTWMVSKEAFDKNGGVAYIRQHPVGTGPFKFVSYEKDVAMKGVRNPDYWQPGKPYLDEIHLIFITDQMTALTLFQSKGADAISARAGKEIADLVAMGIPDTVAKIDTTCLIPDSANPDSPWSKQEVREAAEYAIDKEALAKGMGYGNRHAAYQIPGPDCATYNPSFSLGRKYDVNKAKQLLAQAGYPTGFKTTLIANADNPDKNLCISLQEFWNAVGIQTQVIYPDGAKFTSDYMVGKWQNGIVMTPIAGFNNNYMFIFNFLFGRDVSYGSFLRTPEWKATFDAAISSPTIDVKLMQAFTDNIIKQASLIPIMDGGTGTEGQPYLMDTGFGKRAISSYWNPESMWLNK
jgi:peptide/nickel transport system substrate-binding protein